MSEEELIRLEQELLEKLQKEGGLTKAQTYKIVSLQRLSQEILDLGNARRLSGAVLVELARLDSAEDQKALADLVMKFGFPPESIIRVVRIYRPGMDHPPRVPSDVFRNFILGLYHHLEKGSTLAEVGEEISRFERIVTSRPLAPAEKLEVEEETISLGEARKVKLRLGRGLDVGTASIVAAFAEEAEGGGIRHRLERNAFIDLRSNPFTLKMLNRLGIDYVPFSGRIYVVGGPAFELANVFGISTRRPMKSGMMSSSERDAIPMEKMLIEMVLGHPQENGEICYFSVPADPFDSDLNVVYHVGLIERVLRELGYLPKPMNEGLAVVFAELEEKSYTGIGISCGGGMFNVCVSYRGIPAVTFSTTRGGDWIDSNVAQVLGISTSEATALKERGMDLTRPAGLEQEAVAIYTRSLIKYTLENIKKRFEEKSSMPIFRDNVDVVAGGGTSLLGGFIEVFRDEFQYMDFPFRVGEVRRARDPLNSVSRGCLVAALSDKDLDKTPMSAP